jgi:chorismate lyase
LDIALPASLPPNKEPIWRDVNHIQTSIDADYRPWLLDAGSLTRKLLAKSKGHFRVQLLKQSIEKISFSEKRALCLPLRQWAVLREVILYGQETPWVYARTVIPLATLHGPLRRLHYLGNKPLGEQLFTDPTMEREPVQLARISGELLALKNRPYLLSPSAITWGRRSVFRLSNKPLLVSEIFLPSLVK